MKWFRSNRLGSRLAVFALAIQFLLSFGHFHGSSAPAASTSLDAKLSGLHAQSAAWDRASYADASGPVRLKAWSGHVPSGQPNDDCAICAVMALANAIAVAAPPDLPALQSAALLYLTADAGFVDPNSARVAFQPRAPPVA
jgi:hypothetical protein